MRIPTNRDALIQRFQVKQPVSYHAESLKRLGQVTPQSLRKAAVLIGFVERNESLNVLFTKRARHLKHHPGQVSFPGGKHEDDDTSLLMTALRETHEEVGIAGEKIDVFGVMPELPTISRFSVTPYLAFIEPDYQTLIDRNEVDEVFEVPVEIILDPYHLQSSTFFVNQQPHRVFGINYGQHFIWGMTAQIIQALQAHLMQK
ncbi:coenzyme A pyrophosphatase [Vibrio panuliri]|uniref:Coenzyme A pyrophosphatase n=1 Tax=Vibrio panuliri TaxID=1381081 RepID=A0A1Q9HIY2_9VIBR|nr:CoA pyrophosphatase [Vibrio panuliri]OLQ90269.1 coenzyme A pyrophosphatase [Vibrio panuliri]